jgi:dolichol-phosphate mannosyltransferase
MKDRPRSRVRTLSVVLPAHNEEACIRSVVEEIAAALVREKIAFDIVIVDDNSSDSTGALIDTLTREYAYIKAVHRRAPCGFGRAVREGLDHAKGDAVVVAMGDASDDPEDIVAYYRKLEEGYDCVFGSRFIRGSLIRDYPSHKLLVNRLANTFLRCLFLVPYNDLTNAFKAYRREVIEAIRPIESLYFNITIELPLKALVRGCSVAVIPIRWYGRQSGVSKLKIREMGRRYLYTALYVWLQKILIQDDINEKRV